LRAILAAGLTALLAVGVPLYAQAPAKPAPAKPAVDDTPRFEIRRYIFQGATLVPQAQLEADTRPFTGPNRTFADVQRALEAVERAYSSAGYSAVQVVLPEQELERGEIRFQILEAKIGRVVVEGNKFFDEANIRASVPSLQPGRAPNVDEIARNLRVANENPAKQVNVLLRSGQEEATVDAVVRVVDERNQRYSFTMDNTGNAQTGRLRYGVGYQNANLFNLDHVFTLQYVSAPYTDHLNFEGHPHEWSILPSRKVTILGAGYRVPLYGLGDTLDFTAGYSNVNSGTVLGLFSITGSGVILGARYTRNFNRIGDYDHRLAVSLDYRRYDNKGVRAVGGTQQLIADVTVHPLTLTYTGVYRQQNAETSFSLSGSKNLPGGNDGRGKNFCPSDPNFGVGRNNGLGECAVADYFLWKWSVNHNRALPADWQMRVGVNGQGTDDLLVIGEQFGVGGADSVRGFADREVVSEIGHRGTVELYTPDFGGKTGISGARTRALAFWDFGRVRRYKPGPAEVHGQSIASVGLGLRFSRGTNLSFRVDYGIIIDQGGQQGHGDRKLHASFSYIF
jgi:hemolysin activation/secretion protein